MKYSLSFSLLKKILYFSCSLLTLLLLFQNASFTNQSNITGELATSVQGPSPLNQNLAVTNVPFAGDAFGTSWDGRLIIYIAGNEKGNGWMARVLRPERAQLTNSLLDISKSFSGESWTAPVAKWSDHSFLVLTRKKDSDNTYYTVDALGSRSRLSHPSSVGIIPKFGRQPGANNPFPSDKNGNPCAGLCKSNFIT